MRDLLTALAFLAILVLSAALIAPPFIDWEARRADVDAALSRASGAPVTTRGSIDLRLLPTPRIRVDGVSIGRSDAGEPSLDADGVLAEIELTALLRGEVRFRRIALDVAELRVPTRAGAIAPPTPASGGGDAGPALALDDLSVGSLAVVAVSSDFGARRLASLEDVAVTAPALAGPWRIEARYAGETVRVATGRPDASGAIAVKIVAGESGMARYDVDGALSFVETPEGFVPRLSGQARIDLAAPPGPGGEVAAPAVIRTRFESDAIGFALDDIVVEPGDPSIGSQLEGSGFLRLDDPRLQVSLSGRRLALDAISRSPLAARLLGLREAAAAGARLPPVDFSIALGAVGFGGEELLDARARAVLEDGVLSVAEASLVAPGDARVAFSGEIDAIGLASLSGNARLDVRDPARLSRFLAGAGLDSAWLTALQGPAFEVAGDVEIDREGFALRGLSVAAGDARIGGEVAYDFPPAGERGRLVASIVADAVDVAALPRFDAFAGLGEANEVSLTVEAEAVRFEGGEDAGRIVARLSSDGRAVVVDTLEITGLAGASARVSGRIAEDGAGIISGRLEAERAAPLLALLARFQPDAPFAFAPAFIRDGSLDLAVAIERAPPSLGLDAPALRTTLEGDVAGGPFSARATTIAGRSEELIVDLSTQDTRSWLDVDHPLITGRPSAFRLELRRAGAERFAATVTGDIAGLRMRSTRPVSIDAATRALREGEVVLSSADMRPAFALLGLGAGGDVPAPIDLRATMASDVDGTARVALAGSLAGSSLNGTIGLDAEGRVAGSLTAGSLSLPVLLDVVALDIAEGGETARWSAAPFGEVAPPAVDAAIDVRTPRLDLGRGFVLADASLTITTLRDGVTLRDVDGSLGEGRVFGEATLRRSDDGTLALVGRADFADLPSELVAPGSPLSGRLTGSIDFGGSGGSVVEIVGDLAGGGTLAVGSPRVAGLAPAGLARGLELALDDDDPLGGRRLQAIIEERLGDGDWDPAPFSSALTLVGGALRLDPLRIAGDGAAWSGAAVFDLLNGSLDVRGLLEASAPPSVWTGAPPSVALGWAGRMDDARRSVDVGPLTSGVAQIVLQRELDRIEAFEREANERARRIEALRMEQARAADEERWAQELLHREEERLRLEAEEAARRIEAEEAARQAAEEEARRAAEEAARRAAEEAQRLQAQQEFERAMEAEREAIRRLLDGSSIGDPEPDGGGAAQEQQPLRLLPPGFGPN